MAFVFSWFWEVCYVRLFHSPQSGRASGAFGATRCVPFRAASLIRHKLFGERDEQTGVIVTFSILLLLIAGAAGFIFRDCFSISRELGALRRRAV